MREAPVVIGFARSATGCSIARSVSRWQAMRVAPMVMLSARIVNAGLNDPGRFWQVVCTRVRLELFKKIQMYFKSVWKPNIGLSDHITVVPTGINSFLIVIGWTHWALRLENPSPNTQRYTISGGGACYKKVGGHPRLKFLVQFGTIRPSTPCSECDLNFKLSARTG